MGPRDFGGFFLGMGSAWCTSGLWCTGATAIVLGVLALACDWAERREQLNDRRKAGEDKV